MSKQARVIVAASVGEKFESGWELCFQWCKYQFAEHEQYGYRFIWKRPDGTLQAARGQARLPNMEIITKLIETAKKEGWGFKGDETPISNQ